MRGDDPYYSGNNFSSVTCPHTRGMFPTSLFCVLTPPDRKHIRAEPIFLSSGGNLSHLLLPAFSFILLFCFFQQLFFCTHNRISQKYPPYRMSGKEGKNRYYNGVNVFFEYITLYLRGVPELTLRRSVCLL